MSYTSVGNIIVGLGAAGSLLFYDGIDNLNKNNSNKKMAKAEIIAGGVFMLAAALRISYDLGVSTSSTTKKYSIQEQSFFNKYRDFIPKPADILALIGIGLNIRIIKQYNSIKNIVGA